MIEPIAQMIAEKLGLRKWTFQFLLMPMGYDLLANKFTLVIRTEDLSRKFIAKVSSSPSLNDFLRVEAEKVVALSNLGIKSIPDTILNGMLDNRYYLVQEFIEGRKPSSSEGAFDKAYSSSQEWLRSLLTGRTAGSPVEPEAVVKKAESFNSTISEFFPLSESIPLMQRFAPQTKIPTSWIHGDFWHGNLIIDQNEKLWVTDFAFASPNEPPIDVLDLIVDYSPSMFFEPERISKYVSSFIPKEISPIFLLIYLLNRKVAIKVESKKRLYKELLILNLSEELSKIREASLLRQVVSRIQSQ